MKNNGKIVQKDVIVEYNEVLHYQVAVSGLPVVHLFGSDDTCDWVDTELIGDGGVNTIDIESIVDDAVIIAIGVFGFHIVHQHPEVLLL